MAVVVGSIGRDPYKHCLPSNTVFQHQAAAAVAAAAAAQFKVTTENTIHALTIHTES